MHTHASRLVRGGVLLVALVVSVCVIVSSTDHAKAQAAAQIDISGDWIFTVLIGGNPFEDCAGTITQAGTGLSMALDCPSLPGQQGTLSGTIDTATGDFSVSGAFTKGIALDLTGTASPDGNSISGSFTNTVGVSGTFHGVRQLAATPAATVAAALPGTGSGGDFDQSSSGLPMVAWLALASASLAVLCLGVGLRRRARRG